NLTLARCDRRRRRRSVLRAGAFAIRTAGLSDDVLVVADRIRRGVDPERSATFPRQLLDLSWRGRPWRRTGRGRPDDPAGGPHRRSRLRASRRRYILVDR